MDILKNDFARKQSFVLAGLGVVLVLSLFALSSSKSYLYRSRADETPETVRKSQDSISIISVDMKDYSCVKSLSYLPDEGSLGCFAQIECSSKVAGVIPSMCTQDNNTLSCLAPVSACLSKDAWIEQAAQICGCP